MFGIILKQALWVTIKITAPILLVCLVIGLIVSVFQTVTQINENTLSFAPKLLCVLICISVMMPFIFRNLKTFAINAFDCIAVSN
jgi:flagellar biosynthesis protein FliQ